MRGVEYAAEKMVINHGLDVGFDIHALCNTYADVAYVQIPDDIDAILFGLVGEPRLDRPHIALNVSRIGNPTNLADHQRRRLRYTIAHELGHLELSWHSGLTFCKEGGESNSEQDGFELPRTESEAHLFARRILVPPSQLRQRLELQTKEEILTALDVADVHFSVALRSLVEVLPPGHIVAATKDTGVERSYRSFGTSVPAPIRNSSIQTNTLNKLSERRVVGRVGGRKVYWWILPASVPLEHVEGGASAKVLIRGILDSLDLSEREFQSRRSSVAGKEGVIVNQIKSGHFWPSPEAIAALITQKVGADGKLAAIFGHPDFPRYVAARAVEIASQGYDSD
ncbi:ImmA/IrrE family metallo-endopeptidase [Rhodococcus sp. NPDC055024]